ncbi:MAG: prepilin-type N-terminal cleavage/methylation domain-containing protein [Gammaproteobacteria bacterium]|nr:prepilin-type N-terminal cleavage/methylation domain-containing protein [Gammaproteobacteria bacterium]
MKSSGFTLIELLIAIAIVGILASIAVPTYQNYTRRARYTEIVNAAAPYKLGVSECFQVAGELSECTAGKNGVPRSIASGKGIGLVDSITVASNGKIVITPKAKFGIKTQDTYELIPADTSGQLTWSTAGGGVKEGYAN